MSFLDKVFERREKSKAAHRQRYAQCVQLKAAGKEPGGDAALTEEMIEALDLDESTIGAHIEAARRAIELQRGMTPAEEIAKLHKAGQAAAESHDREWRAWIEREEQLKAEMAQTFRASALEGTNKSNAKEIERLKFRNPLAFGLSDGEMKNPDAIDSPVPGPVMNGGGAFKSPAPKLMARPVMAGDAFAMRPY